MKVQVFEPFAGWHHTKYVALLLPTLVRLLAAGLLSEVIVTTTKSHYESDYFADLLAAFKPIVTFDIIPTTHHDLPGVQVARLLVDAVRRIRPQYLVSTSANNGLLPLAMSNLVASPFPDPDMTSIGIIHNGNVGQVHGIGNRARDLAQRISRRYAPWTEIHVVNPLLFDTIIAQERYRPRRVRLLPDPVAAPQPLNTTEARAILGLPADGRYVGQIGKSDARKAIPELLQAFRSARLRPRDRLLIAGKVYEPYKRLIENDYADLLHEGRIIVIDRYLTERELQAAYFALDVSAVAYHTEELSGNMLAAVASGKPVIARNTGYTGMLIKTFAVGWGVDIDDSGSFSATLETALDESASYVMPDRTLRLLQFHQPQNFVDTLLRPLYERLQLPTGQIKTWDWVMNDDASARAEAS